MNKKEGLPSNQYNPDDQLIASSEGEVIERANLEELKVGEKLLITTEKRTYTIERRPDGFYISGHPQYCPTPVRTQMPGSILIGNTQMDFIIPNAPMGFEVEGQSKKKTSRVLKVRKG